MTRNAYIASVLHDRMTNMDADASDEEFNGLLAAVLAEYRIEWQSEAHHNIVRITGELAEAECKKDERRARIRHLTDSIVAAVQRGVREPDVRAELAAGILRDHHELSRLLPLLPKTEQRQLEEVLLPMGPWVETCREVVREFGRRQAAARAVARAERIARGKPPEPAPATAEHLCSRCARRERHFDTFCKRCANELGVRPRGKV